MCYIPGQWLSNPNRIFQMNSSVHWDNVSICTHLKTNTAGNKGNTRASSAKLMETHQYQHCRREPFYETIDPSAFCTATKMKHNSKHLRKEIYLILRQTEEYRKSGRRMKHYTSWQNDDSKSCSVRCCFMSCTKAQVYWTDDKGSICKPKYFDLKKEECSNSKSLQTHVKEKWTIQTGGLFVESMDAYCSPVNHHLITVEDFVDPRSCPLPPASNFQILIYVAQQKRSSNF